MPERSPASEVGVRATAEPVVAFDALGAEGGAEVVIEGVGRAVADGTGVRVFGREAELGDLQSLPGVEVVDTDDVIGNHEEPVAAVRARPEASIVRAAADVASGSSDALASPGSTGATMTAALFAMKRIRGVQRPALAVQLPAPGIETPPLLLDVGANAEARPSHLTQFAYLGSAFYQAVLGVERPRVALLSVGEEDKKGSRLVTDAHAALAERGGIGFEGNIEGGDLLGGAAEVIVTDGFTGNVTLKTIEGTARAVGDAVRAAARSGARAALGGLLIRSALDELRGSLDPDRTGGAILLGLRGVAVVGHGSAGAEGIANQIRLAARAVEQDAIGRTTTLLEKAGAGRAAMRADAGPGAKLDPAAQS
jgi:glycerol-3-phosphate acyltransferase PlsX